MSLEIGDKKEFEGKYKKKMWKNVYESMAAA